jgi:hypothetical protein
LLGVRASELRSALLSHWSGDRGRFVAQVITRLLTWRFGD